MGLILPGSVALKIKAASELCGLYFPIWSPLVRTSFHKEARNPGKPSSSIDSRIPLGLLRSQIVGVDLNPHPRPVAGSHGCPNWRPSVGCVKGFLLAQVRSTRKKTGKECWPRRPGGPWELSFGQPQRWEKCLKVEGSSLLHHCLLSHFTRHMPRKTTTSPVPSASSSSPVLKWPPEVNR